MLTLRFLERYRNESEPLKLLRDHGFTIQSKHLPTEFEKGITIIANGIERSYEVVDSVLRVIYTYYYSHGTTGAGLYQCLSLMNHSCDPNITHILVSGGECYFLATKQIKAGDELTVSYRANIRFDECRRVAMLSLYDIFNKTFCCCRTSLCVHATTEIMTSPDDSKGWWIAFDAPDTTVVLTRIQKALEVLCDGKERTPTGLFAQVRWTSCHKQAPLVTLVKFLLFDALGLSHFRTTTNGVRRCTGYQGRTGLLQ